MCQSWHSFLEVCTVFNTELRKRQVDLVEKEVM